MPYKYLDEIATADVAFKAWGKDEKELFSSACDAMMNIMVEDLNTIGAEEKRSISVEDKAPELLLFKFLQEILFLKDSESIFLRVSSLEVVKKNSGVKLSAGLCGEFIDKEKHRLGTDIKAVTLHMFKLEKKGGILEATVVVDI